MKHKGQKIQSFICHFYLIILTIIAIFPLVWIILSSIKGKGELTGNPTGFYQRHLHWNISDMLFLTWDSLIILKIVQELHL